MEYFKPFIIGGLVISGSKFISKFVAPEFSPLVGGLPTGIIASFFLNKDSEKIKYYNGYVYSSIILALSVFIIDYICNNTKWSVNIVSVIGLFLWAISSYFIINYFKTNEKKASTSN
jgi:hypothetical protein